MTSSKEVGELLTMVKGWVSMSRIFGIHKKQCVPGTARDGDRRRIIRVPPCARGVIVARLS